MSRTMEILGLEGERTLAVDEDGRVDRCTLAEPLTDAEIALVRDAAMSLAASYGEPSDPDGYTCARCPRLSRCVLAWDGYNLWYPDDQVGDCLWSK